MSEHDMEAIDAALRRQFEPPALDNLNDRIRKAAEATEMMGDEAAPALEDVNERVVSAAERAETSADRGRRGNSGGQVVFAIALATAAAMILTFSWPSGEKKIEIATATTPSQTAGKQLDAFLGAAAYPTPPGGAICTSEEPPPQDCAAPEGEAQLPESDELQLVWECGGLSGVDCSAHDLPAARLMIVKVLPEGPDVVVCIESPSADPKPELPAESDYNIFRRTLGEFVLYEVTPLAEPRAMTRLAI